MRGARPLSSGACGLLAAALVELLALPPGPTVAIALPLALLCGYLLSLTRDHLALRGGPIPHLRVLPDPNANPINTLADVLAALAGGVLSLVLFGGW